MEKIEQYLQKYGYPNIEEHGEDATFAVWMVIHHAPFESEARQRNFKYIYEAWKKKEIKGGDLTFFLNRMYDFRFGHFIKWDKNFTEEIELDTLIQSLKLQGITKAIDQKYGSKP